MVAAPGFLCPQPQPGSCPDGRPAGAATQPPDGRAALRPRRDIAFRRGSGRLKSQTPRDRAGGTRGGGALTGPAGRPWRPLPPRAERGRALPNAPEVLKAVPEKPERRREKPERCRRNPSGAEAAVPKRLAVRAGCRRAGPKAGPRGAERGPGGCERRGRFLLARGPPSALLLSAPLRSPPRVVAAASSPLPAAGRRRPRPAAQTAARPSPLGRKAPPRRRSPDAGHQVCGGGRRVSPGTALESPGGESEPRGERRGEAGP